MRNFMYKVIYFKLLAYVIAIHNKKNTVINFIYKN
jgi:hypothetical protein